MESNTKPQSIFTNTNENIKLNEDILYKPLRSYFLYVILRVFKSISTIVILTLTLVAAVVLSLLPSFFPSDQKQIVVYVAPMILATTLVIFSATFGVAKSLELFVGFQAEGTELIIVSKPISRTQILITKFSFLFILGLVYCSLITGFTAIGFAVVGFDDYAASGLSIGGIFLAVLLSYMIMGLLAIAISIISDTSDKLAKGLPTLILSISVTCSLMVPQLITMTNQNPTTKQVEDYNNRLIAAVIAKRIKYKDFEVKQMLLLSPMPFSYSKDMSSLYLSGSILLNYSDTTIPSAPKDKAVTISADDFRINRKTEDLDERKKIYEFATQLAIDEFNANGLQTTGQGWTAFNYINPISAFLSISGISISMTPTRAGGLPYNYTFEGFSKTGPKLSADNRFNYPAMIAVDKVTHWDPQWALGLLWTSIWVGLGAYTVIGYHRKDFK